MNYPPLYCNIPEVFIRDHGTWGDAEIEFCGIRMNINDIEDVLQEDYREHCEENNLQEDYLNGFTEYIKSHIDDVYSAIYDALISKQDDVYYRLVELRNKQCDGDFGDSDKLEELKELLAALEDAIERINEINY